MTRFLTCFIACFILAIPAEATAHLANFGSWEVTREYLGQLFPEATEFKAKKHSFSPAEVTAIEKELGFELYPEDHNPTFYIARQTSGETSRFLGVAVFIDPRVEPKMLGGAVLRLECGIAVDPDGAVERVRIFEYRGDLALTRPEFLDQLAGRTLESEFEVGKEIQAVEGEEEESQLVANAAYEALYLMKIALGGDQSTNQPTSREASCSGCTQTPGRSNGALLVLSILSGCVCARRRVSRDR